MAGFHLHFSHRGNHRSLIILMKTAHNTWGEQPRYSLSALHLKHYSMNTNLIFKRLNFKMFLLITPLNILQATRREIDHSSCVVCTLWLDLSWPLTPRLRCLCRPVETVSAPTGQRSRKAAITPSSSMWRRLLLITCSSTSDRPNMWVWNCLDFFSDHRFTSLNVYIWVRNRDDTHSTLFHTHIMSCLTRAEFPRSCVGGFLGTWDEEG